MSGADHPYVRDHYPHLARLVGRRVAVNMTDPGMPPNARGPEDCYGILTELRASGPRVRFDGEDRERTVASWRIAAERGAPAIDIEREGR